MQSMPSSVCGFARVHMGSMGSYEKCHCCLQAYPTKRALAEVFKGRLAGAGDKRKLTKLKRVILRERSAKAAADAAAAHEAALMAAANAAAFREEVSAQLQARPSLATKDGALLVAPALVSYAAERAPSWSMEVLC